MLRRSAELNPNSELKGGGGGCQALFLSVLSTGEAAGESEALLLLPRE